MLACRSDALGCQAAGAGSAGSVVDVVVGASGTRAVPPEASEHPPAANTTAQSSTFLRKEERNAIR